MKTAQEKNVELARTMSYRFGLGINRDEAAILRRAEMTLHRWAEEECNGTIQREGEQQDGKPFRVYNTRDIRLHSTPIPDREAGALKRIAKVCKELGLHYYHQTDPRGCALYVSTEPLTASDYTKGIACCD